jgi:heme/copper-type cytochrome/quinol oxidase subunit 2
MSAPLTAFVIFVCMLCGMALGSYLRLVLPDDHTQADSKDILMTSAGMMATLIALIIGLLVTSAKDTYDVTSTSIT